MSAFADRVGNCGIGECRRDHGSYRHRTRSDQTADAAQDAMQKAARERIAGHARGRSGQLHLAHQRVVHGRRQIQLVKIKGFLDELALHPGEHLHIEQFAEDETERFAEAGQ